LLPVGIPARLRLPAEVELLSPVLPELVAGGEGSCERVEEEEGAGEGGEGGGGSPMKIALEGRRAEAKERRRVVIESRG
jgi:hypothetical protein